jgi:hypothetical protein
MKISAVEAIKKFYAEKGFRDTKVTIVERKDTTFNNTLALDFVIDKGPKVKINNINFGRQYHRRYQTQKTIKRYQRKIKVHTAPGDSRVHDRKSTKKYIPAVPRKIKGSYIQQNKKSTRSLCAPEINAAQIRREKIQRRQRKHP